MNSVRVNLENNLRIAMKRHGFTTAAEEMEMNVFRSNNALRQAIETWKGYPNNMDIYPTQLTPKNYSDLDLGGV